MGAYLETELIISPFNTDAADILSAMLADEGYDSFLPTDRGTKCYIRKIDYCDGVIEKVIKLLPIDCKVEYSNREIADEDWNKRWVDESFKPITIGKECIIHSPYHSVAENIRYDIKIDPKMAFGSGHHETTAMMAEWIIETPIKNKSVLDMGCGTGILAILASKCGASFVTAIDIDEMAYANTVDNIALNNTHNISVRFGGEDTIGSDKFDIILANINLNVLVKSIARFSHSINNNGLLFVSGFFTTDIPALTAAAKQYGFDQSDFIVKGDWASVKYTFK